MKKIMSWFRKEKTIPKKVTRRKVDTQTIRNRLSVQGWKLREFPIKRNHPDPSKRGILQWKVTAIKAEKSFEVSCPTLEEAIKYIGKTLGVVSKEE